MQKDAADGRFERVIVFRTDRLGDLILSFPVVEALKQALPGVRVDLYVSPYTQPWARLQRNVQEAIPDRYPGLQGLPALVRLLRIGRYDLAVHLFPLPRLALAARLAGVPVRVGTVYRYFSFLFNRRIRLHRRNAGMHERDLNLKLIEGMGIRVGQVKTGLVLPPALSDHVRTLLKHCGIDPRSRPLVVLHPGSGGSSLTWPPEHFGRLATRILRERIQVLVTGSEGDRSVVDRMKAHVSGEVVDLCGRLGLEQLACLLSLASLVVSNSTGPLHLADALGTKVIGLYSPYVSAAPHRWGPYGQPENVIVPEVGMCPRCTRERCEKYNCMETIRPDVVADRTLKMLSSLA